ncbi:EcsC family protein [Neobacillus niacini]|uniref:EcsC family protein n=1 Tax=Neobacillus niacini TaxID=86668 RepID=UPI002FFF7753
MYKEYSPVLSEYEKMALKEIHEWKNPNLNWFDKAMEVVNMPIDKAYEAMKNVPGFETVMEKSFGGIVNLLNDAAQKTVRPEAIYSEYREKGNSIINFPKDIFKLDLENVDKVIGYLGAKYKSLAGVEGAATGAVGVAGIPVDIVALLTLNLRAIGEYATYCGYDMDSQEERLFALNILYYSSSPTDAAKQAALAQLIRIAKDVARNKTWKILEEHMFVTIVQRIAKSLSIRLTKAKLAQIIPYAGAVIGGGFNIYYTDKVCDAAFYLYRERFLAEKYGPKIIEETVKPVDNILDYDYYNGGEIKA